LPARSIPARTCAKATAAHSPTPRSTNISASSRNLGLFSGAARASEQLIGHFFGAFIIEANQYPEIQSYIGRIRKNFHQPEAFAEFDSVAKEVESDKRFASLLGFGKTMCNPSPVMSVNRHRPGACPEGPPCTPGD